MSEIFDQIAGQLSAQTGNAGNPPVPPVAPPAPEPPAPPSAEPPAPPVAPVAPPVPPAAEPPAGDPPVKKEWYEDSDPTPPANPAQPQTQTNPFEDDEDIKLILEYKKSGKTLKDFVAEYQVPDVDTLSDEQIVKNGMKEFFTLSDEEYETAVYEYENAPILQKKQMAQQMREQYKLKNQEKLKQLSGQNSKYAEHQAKAIELFNKEIVEFREKVVDQELYGLRISAEMADSLVKYAQEEITFQRPDGTYDIEKIMSFALWGKYGKDLVKANVTKARNEGKEQVIREVTNPSPNVTGGGRTVGSGLEALDEAFRTKFPG